MASTRPSRLTPLQVLLMAGITILFLPLLVPLTFALSPMLLFGGLLWAVFKRSQPHVEHFQTSGAEQVSLKSIQSPSAHKQPSANSELPAADITSSVSNDASSASPVTDTKENASKSDTGSSTKPSQLQVPASTTQTLASKTPTPTKSGAADTEKAFTVSSNGSSAVPLTDTQNSTQPPESKRNAQPVKSEPVKQQAAAPTTSSASKDSSSKAQPAKSEGKPQAAAPVTGSTSQDSSSKAQPVKSEPAKQQAAAPATGSAALLARIRAQRGAGAKTASDNGKAAAPAQAAEVIIAFASQTGTAQEIARNIQAESSQHGVQSKVASFNELGFDALGKGNKGRKQVVVMVVSSTGEGDPPDNAVRFFGHSKQRSLASDALQHIQFTCLGLGDSNYTRYMAVPRSFKGRFSELGAQSFYPHMEADEVDGLEEFVDKWIAGLWAPLKAAAHGSSQSEASTEAASEGAAANGNAAVAQAGNTASNPPNLTPTASQTPSANGLTPQAKEAIPEGETIPSIKPGAAPLKGVPALPECRVKLIWQDDADKARQIRQAESAHPTKAEAEWRDPEGLYSPEQPFWGAVSDARALTSADCERQVLHVEVSIEGSGMQYQPGDSIGVLPHNSPELVQGILQHLGQDGQQTFSVASSSGDGAVLLQHLHWPCSLEGALAAGCDLTSVPRKSLLRLLAEHCSKAEERQSLLHLCSSGGRQAYTTQIKEAQPSLLDLFHQYPSCKPPLAALLDSLPPLAPRMYSISSAPLQLPNAVQVAFTVVKYPTPAGVRQGVATTWLQQQCQQLLAGQVLLPEERVRLPIYLRRGGSFGVPKLESGLPNLAAPMLMVGPGTGVAPFRGFLQQRQQQLKGHQGEVGTACLYFGCRHKDQDYLYRQDLKQLQKSGILNKLHVAFSRAHAEKIYVQHLMQRDSKEVFALLQHPDVHIYICGDGSSMAKDVHSALVGVFQSQGNMTANEANAHLANLTKQHRYIRDIWS